MPLAKIQKDGVWRLLKVGGRLAKGCCCGPEIPCPPGEVPLDCQKAGKTGMGADPGTVYPLDPTQRGLMKVDFTVQQGEAELKVLTANIGGAIRAKAGQTLSLVICKPVGVPDISFGVDDFGTNAQWEYSFSCLKQCCEVPGQNRARQLTHNPLP